MNETTGLRGLGSLDAGAVLMLLVTFYYCSILDVRSPETGRVDEGRETIQYKTGRGSVGRRWCRRPCNNGR